jgi:hypothetical protein
MKKYWGKGRKQTKVRQLLELATNPVMLVRCGSTIAQRSTDSIGRVIVYTSRPPEYIAPLGGNRLLKAVLRHSAR